ncbi:hypothetical protein ACLKA6_000570 [Drosophila palustris]
MHSHIHTVMPLVFNSPLDSAAVTPPIFVGHPAAPIYTYILISNLRWTSRSTISILIYIYIILSVGHPAAPSLSHSSLDISITIYIFINITTTSSSSSSSFIPAPSLHG